MEPTNTSTNGTPTPEEIAFYEQATAPSGVNPIRDLSADDLFSLATQDKQFNLVNEFRNNKDLWADQATIQKVAYVNKRIKQRGFQFSDIPGMKEALEGNVGGAVAAVGKPVWEIAKGFGKQAWNYANALIGVPIAGAIGEITGDANRPGFHTELAQEGQRRVMENIAGTESAMFGVAQLGKKALNKARKSALAYSGVEETTTPEQDVSDLWSDVGVGDIAEDITKGKGAFLEPVGGEVRKELEAAGKPIRPQEVESLAAGDPLSFYTYGKAFGAAGQVVGRAGQGIRAALPARVTQAVEATAAKLPTAEKVAGKAIEATGNLVDLGGRAVKVAGPTVGFIKGASTGGPIGALAGLKGGEIAAKLGNKVSKVGEKLKNVGKEVAGEAPVTSATAQLAKDVAASVPGAASEVGKGLAFDIGTAALTSESPQDTQSVGIGAFFGGLNAARRAGGRIISGQIVAPRQWGIDKYVPPSGQVDSSFENMHIAATKNAPPAVQQRLNAIRQFLKGSHADADVFLAKDSQSLEQVLKQNGVSDTQAKTLAAQEGFFTAKIPGKNGGTRRVIIARNVDAAPHEAFHAIQDVLGETANQQIDQIVRQEYGPQWEQEGQRYADRIQPGGDWRETILDSTGTGLNYAKEKIAMAVGNEYRNTTGAEPPAQYVQERTKEILGQKMDAAVQANPGVDPNQIAQHVWRDILSPQEATAVADTYLARELAAENFDMVFKNLSTALQNPGLPGRLARVVANLVSTLGGEPLSPEVTSQIGAIAPKFKVAEAVRQAPNLVEGKPSLPKPEISPISKPKGPSEPLLPSPKPLEPKPSEGKPTAVEPNQEASEIAAEAPTTPIAGGTASPRELLGTVAEAIAQRKGVKVNYLSAPEEPAAATTSNRDVRREMIETFRTMPPEARSLWEKTFFPERILKLKGDKYQVLGWAPEVFAANAHKLAAKLVELGVAESSPYPIEKNTFTAEGWKALYDDVQKFVQNQMGGRTGAGEQLVVPKLPGMSAPPEKGKPVALDQTKADFINMLFNFRLPDTARVQKGKLPLNIAGQEVSEATKPGRTAIPIIPRGKFEGAEAERQGIAGREIKEVNPLRQQIEAAAQAKGVAMPEFIEAIQRLNLENIKEVQIAPEVPEFRGNTLTLSAGFQPRPKEKRALKSAAVRDEDGKVWEGTWHGDATDVAIQGGGKFPFEDGYTTNTPGEFLTRQEAFERATQLDQIKSSDELPEGGPVLYGSKKELISEAVRFQPPKSSAEAEKLVKEVSSMDPKQFEQWARSTPDGLTEAAYQVGLNAPSQAFVNYLKAAEQAFGKKAMEFITTDPEQGMVLAAQQQFFNEAWQAATGEGSAGYSLHKEKPGYQPKFPLDAGAETSEARDVQLQPKKSEKETRGEELVRKKLLGQVIEPIQDYGNITRFSELWVSPEGDIFNAMGGGVGFNHETWARKYIMGEFHWTQMFGSAAGANTAARMAESIAERRGWRKVYVGGRSGVRQKPGAIASAFGAPDRFVNIPNGLFVDKGLSKEQKAALEQVAIENKVSIFNRGNDKTIFDPNEDGDVQLQPKKAAKEFKLKPAKQGFSKTWILPDGTPVQLGGQWHHDYINENAPLRKKYNLPEDEDTEQNRIEALKQGFVRVNWAQQTGRMTIEAREKDWAKQREAVRSLVERNADNIDWIKVSLFDDTVKTITNQDDAKVFTLDDIEKPAMIPFLDLGDKRATGDASERLFQKAVEQSASKPQLKTGLTKVEGEGYWVDPKGEFIQAPDSHEMTAYEINQARGLNMDLDKLQREMDKIGSDAVYKAMNAKKYLRAYNVGDDILAVEGLGKWEDLPRTQREKMEDAAIESGRILYFNDRKIGATDPGDLGVQFQPSKGVQDVAEDYAKKAGISYKPSAARAQVPEDTAREIADFFEAAKHDPEDPEVKKSYDSLTDETIAQYNAIIGAGYKIEPWTKEGEPYKTSTDMMRDVQDKKHLYFKTTDSSFGTTEADKARSNFMLEDSGIKIGETPLVVNDVFRAVHDFFGHAKEGNQFGPKGEFNAWKDHSEMYSPDAQGALAAETLAQNFWVNFGKQMRNAEGKIPQKGEPGYVPLPERQFAEQKNVVVPGDLLEKVRAQFQPQKEDLFGAKPTYTKSEVSKMTRAELKEAFPEAIVPKSKDDSIPSDILGSPLYKKSGNEEAAVKAFADGLVKFARSQKNDPIFKAGVSWYDEFTPMLKKEFGENADLFAELLAATSPQTSVETNFAYAVDAIESLKAGRFKKIIPKFNEGLEMIADGSWEAWYNKELPNIPEPPKNPTPAAFLEHWIFKHDLKPRQTNGKLYGIHSLPVLQVFARKWLTDARGPKTLNFVENLLGKGEEATIDLWADRTMRRIGYEGQERWRILPKNIGAVTDKDFAFSQKAFRAAAERLGMKPSALQAALWFAEKKLWAENGWSPLDLGDFRAEMKKLPMMRQGFKSRLTTEKKSAKVRPAEALDLDLIKPR